MKRILLIVIAIVSQNCWAQDSDGDDIPDAIELELAKRFAPEWRYSAQTEEYLAGDNQNYWERFYPQSVEDWFQDVLNEQGEYPIVKATIITEDDTLVEEIILNDISYLDQLVLLNYTLDDSIWIQNDGVTRKLVIDNFPEKMSGDPVNFPTYFHCEYDYVNMEVNIGFFLWHPQDHKGCLSLPIVGNIDGAFGTSFGQHRGDWEGINVRVSGLFPMNWSYFEDTEISRVSYSGHSSSWILPNSPDFSVKDNTHPVVYISWGSHAMYPTSGIWQDHHVDEIAEIDLPWWVNVLEFASLGTPWWTDIVEIAANSSIEAVNNISNSFYEDFFLGQGLSVEAWQDCRELINVGEIDNPEFGWLNFKGKWGPDETGENSSSKSPPNKSFWSGGYSTQALTWAERMANEDGTWNSPIQLIQTTDNSCGNSKCGDSKIVFFENSQWTQESATLWPGYYPNKDIIETLPPDTATIGSFFITYPIVTLPAGHAKIKLFEHENFGGQTVTITQALNGNETYYWSDWNSFIIEGWDDTMDNYYVFDKVVSEVGNISGDGTWPNPFNSVEEGVDALTPNGYLAIGAGEYHENFLITKPMKIRAICGPVHIGE